MTDTFSKFGYSFQIKLIAALFKDRLFLQQICDILRPEYMESESNQWIIETIIDYFSEYSSLPTLEVMKVRLDDVDNDVLKTTISGDFETFGFDLEKALPPKTSSQLDFEAILVRFRNDAPA